MTSFPVSVAIIDAETKSNLKEITFCVSAQNCGFVPPFPLVTATCRIFRGLSFPGAWDKDAVTASAQELGYAGSFIISCAKADKPLALQKLCRIGLLGQKQNRSPAKRLRF
jgi:hypothetical protein